MDTYKTQDAIQSELGDPEIEVVCIGPGGENGVAYGSVQTRMDYFEENELSPLVASCNIYGSATWVIKNADMKTWYAVAAKCQRQSIDVLSATRMIAWASELYEKGIISLADTGGIPLVWGNRDALDRILDQIAGNEGFGAIPASTPEAAAEKLGQKIEPVLNIKGTPVGETNIMNFRAKAIGATVNPRGSDEYRARAGSFDNLGTGSGSRLTAMADPDIWEAKAAMAIVEKAVVQKREREGEGAQITQFGGLPTRETLEALGLSDVASDLEKMEKLPINEK